MMMYGKPSNTSSSEKPGEGTPLVPTPSVATVQPIAATVVPPLIPPKSKAQAVAGCPSPGVASAGA